MQDDFEIQKRESIEKLSADRGLRQRANDLLTDLSRGRYTYNFSWLGRPVIQLPTDLIALQEIIWSTKPDLIVETGIARGGSLIFYSSLLELLGGDGQVLGIDRDIRPHNRKALEEHPLFHRIKLFEGSSIDDKTLARVKEATLGKKRVMVVLDSNHTHEHVLTELRLYSPFVKKDGYLVVLDSAVEDLPEELFSDRPWGKGNNPKTAVWEFLKENSRFEIDRKMDGKLVLTVAPDGYLKCVRD